MDKALKQRLIGATILILLAVIFLPMVLDGPDPEQNRVVSIETPDRPEFEFESRRLPLGEQVARQPDDDAPPDNPDDNSGSADAPITAPASGAADGAQSDVVSVRPLGDRSDSGQVTTAPTEQPAEAVADSQVPAESNDDSAETTGDVSPEPTATAPAARGSAVVQVASFSDADNARRLASQLRGLGFEPSLDSVTTGAGEITRVRVIGLAESETTAAIQRIQSQVDGVNPTALASDAATASSTEPAAGRWAVQVGSYSDAENANNMIEQLKSASFRAFSERSSGGSRTLIKVKVGPVLEREQADQLLAQVKTETGVEGVVVSYP